MSKITNDGLTWSGTGYFNSCTLMPTVGIKGLTQWSAAASLFTPDCAHVQGQRSQDCALWWFHYNHYC